MDIGKKVVHGTIWGVFGGIITAIFGLVIVVILARLLDPIEYGYIPLTFSIVNIISIFADFGLVIQLQNLLQSILQKILH